MHGEVIMEVQIIKDKTNPILKRREISVRVKDKTTPSRIEVKGKLAALLNSKPELIVIEHLDTIYGKQELTGTACIYQTEERLNQLAHKHLVARDAPKAKEGEAEAEIKTEAKSEAKPEGKPKSEAKPEAKPHKAETRAESKPKAEAKEEGKKKHEEK